MSTTQLRTPQVTRESEPTRRNHLIALPDGQPQPSPDLDPYWAAVVIRPAVAADAVMLRRLAALDSARQLVGAAVIAEQRGSVVAAVSLDDGAAIANPFVATAEMVDLLRLRAAQLRRRAAKPSR
jgi:hypothetical protein